MDPTTLMQLIAHLQQQGQMPGQMPPQGQMPPMQPPQQPQGQLPSMMPPQGGQGTPGQDQHHGHGGGLNPLMLLSPMGGMLAGGGGMGALAPMFGLAGLFGSKLFK